ncbi:MAG: hypothetical protein QW273_00430 [Candidatus Pacearchaeota archaeon]
MVRELKSWRRTMNKKFLSFFEIFLLVFGIISFAFLMRIENVRSESNPSYFKSVDEFKAFYGLPDDFVINGDGVINFEDKQFRLETIQNGVLRVEELSSPQNPMTTVTQVSALSLPQTNPTPTKSVTISASPNLASPKGFFSTKQSLLENSGFIKEGDFWKKSYSIEELNKEWKINAKIVDGKLVNDKGEEIIGLQQGVSTSVSDDKVIVSASAESAFVKKSLGIPDKAVLEGDYYVLKNEEGKILAKWNAASGGQTEAQVSHLFGRTGSWYGAAYLLQGLQYALLAYTALSLIGGLFIRGENAKATMDALQKAAFVGIMSFSAVRALIAKGGLLQNVMPGKTTNWLTAHQGIISFGIGALMAWIAFTKFYEKTSTFQERVEFECLPWQAPIGGDDCELCNVGPLPCSEYRCKSLGQSCSIVNKDSRPTCVNTNPRDVSPPVISPWKEKLTPGYIYKDVKTSPPGAGFKIVRNDVNPCIRAFQSIEFGLTTNEPAQCKIDIEKKNNFDEMLAFVGGDNSFKYNHSDILAVPRAKDFANSSIKLEMGNEMTLYVMCRDANGNVNSAPYAIRFCVDNAPDETPPQIKATSVESGSCISSDQNTTLVEFYTDEPAQCKWDFEDKDYDSMTYNMTCFNKIFEINTMLLYTCVANFFGVKREGTKYYIRCEDKPHERKENRVKMSQSFVYEIKTSNKLKIKSVQPNETLYGTISPFPLILRVETLFGCEDNKATCFFSQTGLPNSYIMFYDTDNRDGVHLQRLDLPAGNYTYFIKCVDSGGNLAEEKISFSLDLDTNSPIIARAYYQEDFLKIVTQGNSECVYSTENCDFLFNEGTVMPYANTPIHTIKWDSTKTYYIKCRDEFRNEPSDCSIIIKPQENILFDY